MLEAREVVLLDEIRRLTYFLGVAGWKIESRGDNGGQRELIDQLGSSGEPNAHLLTVVENEKQLWSIVKKELSDPRLKSLLDIGAGLRPLSLARFRTHLALEPFRPYHPSLVRRYQGNVIPLAMTVPESLTVFPDNSIDLVVAFDLIEHLDKADGERLLQEVVRIAKHKVIVFTPDGFMPQHVGPDDDEGWGVTGNVLQTHLSGWDAGEFINHGARVVKCENYHSTVDGDFGALLAVYEKESPDTPTHLSLVIAEEAGNTALWKDFVFELERRALVCEVRVHPANAPWSFSANPPDLPISALNASLIWGDQLQSDEGLLALNAGVDCVASHIEFAVNFHSNGSFSVSEIGASPGFIPSRLGRQQSPPNSSTRNLIEANFSAPADFEPFFDLLAQVALR